MEWIKIQDRLPEIKEGEKTSEDVLVVCISDGISKIISGVPFPNTYDKDEVYRAVDRLIKWNDDIISFRGDRFFGRVTHWMPMPCLPKDELK